MDSAASRLAKDGKCLEYCRELEAQNKSVAIATREELRQWHTQVLRTPVGDVREHSYLCQFFKTPLTKLLAKCQIN